MKVQAENIPGELKEREQWVVWKSVLRNGKSTKAPFQVNGGPASSTDVGTWTSFSRVMDAIGFDGIGFMFSDSDPFTGVDMDACMVDGKQTDPANRTMKMLMSYAERSPSGKGIHAIVKADKPDNKRCKFYNIPGMDVMEIYDRERFFTMTGAHILGTPKTIEPRQEALTALYNRALSLQSSGKINEAPRTEEGSSPQMDDETVIQKLRKAKNGERFNSLFYGGDLAPYNFDESRADLALANMIAWYTQDAEQIERIMRDSILVRPKWDKNKNYIERTITRVLSSLSGRYQRRA